VEAEALGDVDGGGGIEEAGGTLPPLDAALTVGSAVVGGWVHAAGQSTVSAVQAHCSMASLMGSPPAGAPPQAAVSSSLALALLTAQRLLMAGIPLVAPTPDAMTAGGAVAPHPLLQLTSDVLAATASAVDGGGVVVGGAAVGAPAPVPAAALAVGAMGSDRIATVHGGVDALVTKQLDDWAAWCRRPPAVTRQHVHAALAAWACGAPAIVSAWGFNAADGRVLAAAAAGCAVSWRGPIVIACTPLLEAAWMRAFRTVAPSHAAVVAAPPSGPASQLAITFVRAGAALPPGLVPAHTNLPVPLLLDDASVPTTTLQASALTWAAALGAGCASPAGAKLKAGGVLAWVSNGASASDGAACDALIRAAALASGLPLWPGAAASVVAAGVAVPAAADAASWQALSSRLWSLLHVPTAHAAASTSSAAWPPRLQSLSAARLALPQCNAVAVAALRGVDTAAAAAHAAPHAVLARTVVLPLTAAAAAQVALLHAGLTGAASGGSTSVNAYLVAGLAGVGPTLRWQLSAAEALSQAKRGQQPAAVSDGALETWWRTPQLSGQTRTPPHPGDAATMAGWLQQLAAVGATHVPRRQCAWVDDAYLGPAPCGGVCMDWVGAAAVPVSLLDRLAWARCGSWDAFESAFVVPAWAALRHVSTHYMARLSPCPPSTLARVTTNAVPRGAPFSVIAWHTVRTVADGLVACHAVVTSRTAHVPGPARQPTVIISTTADMQLEAPAPSGTSSGPSSSWQAVAASPKLSALRDVCMEAAAMRSPLVLVCHTAAAVEAATRVAVAVTGRLVAVAGWSRRRATPLRTGAAAGALITLLDLSPPADLVAAAALDLGKFTARSGADDINRAQLVGVAAVAALEEALEALPPPGRPRAVVVWDSPAVVVDDASAARALVTRCGLYAALAAVARAACAPVALLTLASRSTCEDPRVELGASVAAADVAAPQPLPPTSDWAVDAVLTALLAHHTTGPPAAPLPHAASSWDTRRGTQPSRAVPFALAALSKSAAASTLRRVAGGGGRPGGGASVADIAAAATYDVAFEDFAPAPALLAAALRVVNPNALTVDPRLPVGDDIAWAFARHRKVMGAALSAVAPLRRHQDRGGLHFSQAFGPPHVDQRLVHAPPANHGDPSVTVQARIVTSATEQARRMADAHPSKPWLADLIPPLPDHVEMPRPGARPPTTAANVGVPPRSAAAEATSRADALLLGASSAAAATSSALPQTIAPLPNPPTPFHAAAAAAATAIALTAGQPGRVVAAGVSGTASASGQGGAAAAVPWAAVAVEECAPADEGTPASSSWLPATAALCGTRERGGEPLWHRISRSEHPLTRTQAILPATAATKWLLPPCSRLSWLMQHGTDPPTQPAASEPPPKRARTEDGAVATVVSEPRWAAGGRWELIAVLQGGLPSEILVRLATMAAAGRQARHAVVALPAAVGRKRSRLQAGQVGGALHAPVHPASANSTTPVRPDGGDSWFGELLALPTRGDVVRAVFARLRDGTLSLDQALAALLEVSVRDGVFNTLPSPSPSPSARASGAAQGSGGGTGAGAAGGAAPATKLPSYTVVAPQQDYGDWSLAEDLLLLRAVAEFGTNFELVREVVRNACLPLPVGPTQLGLSTHPNSSSITAVSRSPLLSRVGIASPLTVHGRNRPLRNARQCSDRYRRLVTRPLHVFANLPAWVLEVAGRGATGSALGAAARTAGTPLHIPGSFALGLGSNGGLTRDGGVRMLVQVCPVTPRPTRMGAPGVVVSAHMPVGRYRVQHSPAAYTPPPAVSSPPPPPQPLVTLADLCSHALLPTVPVPVVGVQQAARGVQSVRTLRQQFAAPMLQAPSDLPPPAHDSSPMLQAVLQVVERLALDAGISPFSPSPVAPTALAPLVSVNRITAAYLPFPSTLPPVAAAYPHRVTPPVTMPLPSYNLLFAPRVEPFRKTCVYIATLRAKEKERFRQQQQQQQQQQQLHMHLQQQQQQQHHLPAEAGAMRAGPAAHTGHMVIPPGAVVPGTMAAVGVPISSAGGGSGGEGKEDTAQRILTKVLALPGVQQLGWPAEHVRSLMSTLIDGETSARIEAVSRRADAERTATGGGPTATGNEDGEILAIVLERLAAWQAATMSAGSGAGGAGGR